MDPSFSAVLTTMGLPGVVIGALAYWCVKLHIELRDERHERLKDVKDFAIYQRDADVSNLAVATTMKEALAEVRTQRERERERGSRAR